MRKLLLLLFVFGAMWQIGQAQQDPMFTKYMFNSLAFNPGFAGSPGYMSARLIYRNQWWSLEGAPTTQSFTIHTPFKERVGLGLTVMNDKIGPSNSSSAFATYAYHLPFGNGKVSIGVQAGMMNWRADWNKLKFKDPQSTDTSYDDDNPNLWLPNFGAGLFYYSQKYYIGLSIPRLLENDINRNVQDGITQWAQLYRHIFLTAGAAFPINGNALVFKPSVLVKSVGLFSSFTNNPNSPNNIGAPTEFEVDLSLLFYDAFWVGTSFRSAFEAKQFGGDSSFDSVDFWIAYYLQRGLRVGAAYDYTLTELQNYAHGSFEIMLGYDMNFRVKRINTPRYF